MSPFILEIVKNPFSPPGLIIIHLVFFVVISAKLLIQIVRENSNLRSRNLFLLAASILIFAFCSFFIFYKLTEIPPSGLEADDGTVAISAYIIKGLGHDLHGKLEYFPYTHIKYHHEKITFLAHTGGIPIYMQSFVQYFAPPGRISMRVESALLMYLSTISVFFILYLITKNVSSSLVYSSLFSILPWTRIMARATPQTPCFAFESACLLLSILYLIRSRSLLAILFYILSLVMVFLCYSPGLMFAPICAVFIPFILGKYSIDFKKLSKKLMFFSLLIIVLMYFEFRDEEVFKWILERAENTNQITGIQSYDFSKLVSNFSDKGQQYLANYIGYLLPQYLFLAGDANLRHNTGIGGQFFVSLVFAFYIGLFFLVEKVRKNSDFGILLTLLLTSHIPASICLEGNINALTGLHFHAFRSSSMLPLAAIVIFIGLDRIYRKSKIVYSIYALAIMFNIHLFYVDYFNEYPKRLGNTAITDPGLQAVSRKALEILGKETTRKLFYSAPAVTVAYHNLDKLNHNTIINGDGILSNVYNYEERGNVEVKKGDLVIIHSNWDFGLLKGRNYKYIMQVRNPYLVNNAVGSSLFEIID